MSMQYDDYLVEHIGNVNRGLNWMWKHLPNRSNAIEKVLLEFDHDASKYDPEEYSAYDAYFYGENKTHQVSENFNRAWLRHIHHNPHHWQYWILFEDDPKTEKPYKALEMPEQYVYEMIADWWAFSWKNGNLNEIFDWYYGTEDQKAHQNTIIFHEKTRKLVESILGELKTAIEKSDEENRNQQHLPDGYVEVAHHVFAKDSAFIEHHGIKGQEWGNRRFQYEDGSLTPEGRKRYLKEEARSKSDYDKAHKSSGSDSSDSEASRSDSSTSGGGAALSLSKDEEWRKKLLTKLASDGKDISSLSDDEFKKYLEDSGLDTKSMSDDELKTIRREISTESSKNKAIDIAKENMTKAAAGTSSASSGNDETEQTSSKSSSSSGSKRSSSGGSSSAAQQQAAQQAITAPKKTTADAVEDATYQAIDKLNKLKEGAFDEKDILGVNEEDFKNRVGMLTGMDLSGLSKSELLKLRSKVQNHYALQKLESIIKSKLSEIMEKYPDAADNVGAFTAMLAEFAGFDVNALSDEEIEELRKKFEELSGDEDNEEESDGQDDKTEEEHLEHSGVKGQKWGIRNGPPYPLGDKEKLDSVKNLNDLMNNGWDYGVLDHGKHLLETDDYDWDKNYRTTPIDILDKEKIGTCWDFVNYQHDKLKNMGIKDNSYLITIQKSEKPNDIVTHTFTTFELGNKNYWLESAAWPKRGVHEINGIEDVAKELNEMYHSPGLGLSIFEYNPEGMDKGLTSNEFFDKATQNLVYDEEPIKHSDNNDHLEHSGRFDFVGD